MMKKTTQRSKLSCMISLVKVPTIAKFDKIIGDAAHFDRVNSKKQFFGKDSSNKHCIFPKHGKVSQEETIAIRYPNKSNKSNPRRYNGYFHLKSQDILPNPQTYQVIQQEIALIQQINKKCKQQKVGIILTEEKFAKIIVACQNLRQWLFKNSKHVQIKNKSSVQLLSMLPTQAVFQCFKDTGSTNKSQIRNLIIRVIDIWKMKIQSSNFPILRQYWFLPNHFNTNKAVQYLNIVTQIRPDIIYKPRSSVGKHKNLIYNVIKYFKMFDQKLQSVREKFEICNKNIDQNIENFNDFFVERASYIQEATREFHQKEDKLFFFLKYQMGSFQSQSQEEKKIQALALKRFLDQGMQLKYQVISRKTKYEIQKSSFDLDFENNEVSVYYCPIQKIIRSSLDMWPFKKSEQRQRRQSDKSYQEGNKKYKLN